MSFDESTVLRARNGQFAGSVAAETDVELEAASLRPAYLSREDRSHLSTEYGAFADGYDQHDIDNVLGNLEGADLRCVWGRHEDGMFTGDSQIVGRVGDGPWRDISPELSAYLHGDGDTYRELNGEPDNNDQGTPLLGESTPMLSDEVSACQGLEHFPAVSGSNVAYEIT